MSQFGCGRLWSSIKLLSKEAKRKKFKMKKKRQDNNMMKVEWNWEEETYSERVWWKFEAKPSERLPIHFFFSFNKNFFSSLNNATIHKFTVKWKIHLKSLPFCNWQKKLTLENFAGCYHARMHCDRLMFAQLLIKLPRMKRQAQWQTLLDA